MTLKLGDIVKHCGDDSVGYIVKLLPDYDSWGDKAQIYWFQDNDRAKPVS